MIKKFIKKTSYWVYKKQSIWFCSVLLPRYYFNSIRQKQTTKIKVKSRKKLSSKSKSIVPLSPVTWVDGQIVWRIVKNNWRNAND